MRAGTPYAQRLWAAEGSAWERALAQYPALVNDLLLGRTEYSECSGLYGVKLCLSDQDLCDGVEQCKNGFDELNCPPLDPGPGAS